MRQIRSNLLIEFSIACFVMVVTLALVQGLIFTASLNRSRDLLQTHSAVMMSGAMIKDADPYSIASMTANVGSLRIVTYATLAGGFAYMYGSLVLIVWRGWTTIKTQRRELESLNAQLGQRVDEGLEALQKANEELRIEVRKQRSSEQALRESNLRLEEAYVELRESQEKITHQERMRAIGQMASGVAHDFNNALGPIVAYTDLLLEVPQTLDNKEEVTGYLTAMRTSALDAASVVRRLREFYVRSEVAEIVEAVNINELIESSISLTEPRWRHQALAEGITINIETDLQEVAPVATNSSNVREVLTNLIINAADALPRGGTITFRTRAEGGRVILEVSDTGTGMPEEVRQRCMDPFFSTKGERGSGLGLAMVYDTIQRAEGTIDINSEVDKGTTFTIRLPAAEAVGVESGLAPPSDPLRSLHILGVDDEPSGLQSLTRLLRAAGHTIDTATNGREGLEKFRAGEYDLVVTARAMPEMNGDQLAAAVKELAPDNPVIMMTGFGDIMEATGERPSGVDLVVSKPVTLATLRDAVSKVRV